LLDNLTLTAEGRQGYVVGVEPLSVPVLAEQVRRRAPASALDRLEAAVGVSQELARAADELLGRFVEEARSEGLSWTDIGRRLGVSKQAARQRFVEAIPVLPARLELRPRLQACLDAGIDEAAAGGAVAVETHHQLLGLFAEGVAAAVFEKLGVKAEVVRAKALEMFPGGARPAPDPPPLSAEAKGALEAAVGLARRGGYGYVGTEHLLAALSLDPGTKARRLLVATGVDMGAIKKELACYIGGNKRRRRRRVGGPELACSFCGKPQRQVKKLIAGPGVYICGDCISKCNDVEDTG
jgi:hypothetical protein